MTIIELIVEKKNHAIVKINHLEVELLLFYFIVEIHTKVNNKLRTKKSVFSHLICKIIQNISH